MTAAVEPASGAFAEVRESFGTGAGSGRTAASADSPHGSVLLSRCVGVASGAETACGASEAALAAPGAPVSGVGASAGTASEVAAPSSEATGIAATGTGTSGLKREHCLCSRDVRATDGTRSLCLDSRSFEAKIKKTASDPRLWHSAPVACHPLSCPAQSRSSATNDPSRKVRIGAYKRS